MVLQAAAHGRGRGDFPAGHGRAGQDRRPGRRLITLSGLRPDADIEIVFTGMRPGEKLFEELSIDGENVSRTAHPKIGITKKRPEDFQRVCEGIARLSSLADTATAEEVRAELQQVVPEYSPSVPGQQPEVPAAASAAVHSQEASAAGLPAGLPAHSS